MLIFVILVRLSHRRMRYAYWLLSSQSLWSWSYYGLVTILRNGRRALFTHVRGLSTSLTGSVRRSLRVRRTSWRRERWPSSSRVLSTSRKCRTGMIRVSMHSQQMKAGPEATKYTTNNSNSNSSNNHKTELVLVSIRLISLGSKYMTTKAIRVINQQPLPTKISSTLETH